MESKNISTAAVNAVKIKSTIKHTQISNVVEGKCNNSDFIVLTTNGVSDWIGKVKFNDLNFSSKDTDVVEYPLKATKKGNEDEGIKAVIGKALRKSKDGDVVLISIYTQEFGNSWKLSHTHKINNIEYEAYSLVFSNTEAVLKAEKESKKLVKFNLKLK